jgi:hypothetical protein
MSSKGICTNPGYLDKRTLFSNKRLRPIVRNPPPVVTTDFLYLRLIGDRSIQEKDFGKIQIDRVVDMQKWVDILKAVGDEHINLAIMTANNHYAGFGPGTVNIFRNMLRLPEAKWEEKEEGGEGQKHLEQYPAIDSKQRTLSDFIN